MSVSQEEKRLNLLIWCLRGGVCLMCVGIAYHDLFLDGPILEYLFIGWYREEETALTVVHTGSYLLLACIPFLFVRRGWPVLLFVSFWMAFRTYAGRWGEVWFPGIVPLENAVRYLGPLGLAGLTAFPRGEQDRIPSFRKQGMIVLLRCSASATFIGHGLAALYHKGQFVDYIIAAGRDLFGVQIAQSVAETMLTGIGIVDVIVAVLILFPFRYMVAVAGWMAFWGFITACARITRLGTEGVQLFLLRAMNWAVPLALFIYWYQKNHGEQDDASLS